MIITISGVSGSGKSTIAILVAKKLKLRHYSAGELQRELAKKHNMTTVEFSGLEAKDPKYDKERDKFLEELGKEKDDFVIDTWLGARFISGRALANCKPPKQAVNVFLDCDIDVRAKRIFEETQKGKNTAGIRHKRKAEKKYRSLQDAKEFILKKEEINRDRWKKYYNFDFMDKTNYDLLIDTTGMTIEEVVDAVVEFVEKEKEEK